MAFVYAWIVPSWADQLLPQLLIEQFGTLPTQCRHIKLMHEEFGSEKIFFDKMTTRSAGLNYHLPKHKFFTFPYCAGWGGGGGGVSNKHCLLTFFFISRRLILGKHEKILSEATRPGLEP